MKKSTLFLLTLAVAMGLVATTAWATGIFAPVVSARTTEGVTWAKPAMDNVSLQGTSSNSDYLTFGSTYVGTYYAPDISLPFVARNYQGWSTVIHVAAIDHYYESDPVEVTTTFYDLAGTLVHTITDSIPHLGGHIYAQKSMSALPEDFVGSARIEVANWWNHAAAATVRVINVGQEGDGLMSYNGQTSPSTPHHIPLVRKGLIDTTLVVMNTGSFTATVVIDIYDEIGALQTSENVSIAPQASYIYNLGEQGLIPDGFVGSAAISADRGVHVVVMDVDEVEQRGAAYAHRPISSPTDWVLPVVSKEYYGWNSNFWILALATNDATITYIDLFTGTPIGSEGTGTLNWHQLAGPFPTVMEDGQIGTAYIETYGYEMEVAAYDHNSIGGAFRSYQAPEYSSMAVVLA